MPDFPRTVALSVLVILGIVAGPVGLVSTPVAAQTPDSGFVDVAASDLPGSGTETDPYVITNASELQAMEDNLDAHYELGADIDASGTSEWDEGSGFDPVGEFGGVFDGNGREIAHLTIDRPNTEDVGLFGDTDGARITSVRLSNVTVSGGDDAGSLAGEFNEESVARDVHTSVSVTGVNDTGGVAGDLEDSSVVRNASVTGTVVGSDNVGGVVGANVGGVVTLSSSQATITATGEQRGGDTARGGGIAGGNYNDGVINHSYAVGSVEAGRTGGITGENFNSSRVAHAYAAGSVTGRTPSQTGGVVGENFRSSTVTDSYWDTEATGQATSAGDATGLTTAQMTGEPARSGMPGLDFETIWQTQPNDYPTLRSGSGGGTAKESLSMSLTSSSVTVGEQTTVTVTVEDASGDAVAGASVEIAGLGVSATTDASGEATLSVDASTPGDYEVTASADGFADATETLTVEAASGSDDPVAQYANENGVVDPNGLLDAAADFRSGDIGPTLLLDVAAAFRSGEPVT